MTATRFTKCVKDRVDEILLCQIAGFKSSSAVAKSHREIDRRIRDKSFLEEGTASKMMSDIAVRHTNRFGDGFQGNRLRALLYQEPMG